MHHDNSPSGSIRAASAEVGRHIDIMSALAAALAVLAAACWVLAAVVAVHTVDGQQNSDEVLMAVGPAVTLTVIAAVAAVAGSNRRYFHKVIDNDVSVVCRRIDELADQLSPVVPANGKRNVADDWQSYIAGVLDRPQASDQ
jgi:hypothetical protein